MKKQKAPQFLHVFSVMIKKKRYESKNISWLQN
jgi:hypothetical protein